MDTELNIPPPPPPPEPDSTVEDGLGNDDSWPKRHPVLTTILAIFTIASIGAFLTEGAVADPEPVVVATAELSEAPTPEPTEVVTTTPTPEPTEPGPLSEFVPDDEYDAAMDVLAVACVNDGDVDACDDLFWNSPANSTYERIGRDGMDISDLPEAGLDLLAYVWDSQTSELQEGACLEFTLDAESAVDGVIEGAKDDFTRDEIHSFLADACGLETVAADEPGDDGASLSQRNALAEAESYLEFSGFSRQGLIDQLSSEYGSQFPLADAEWAVDNLDVDWNEQALREAESYLEFSSFSRQGLIDQLSSEYGSQFTVEQATYAVDQIGL